MENQELIKQVTEKAEKWLTPAYDAETQAEVKRMLENEDKTELIEAFYKDLEFGTGGLRGYDYTLLAEEFSFTIRTNTGEKTVVPGDEMNIHILEEHRYAFDASDMTEIN